MHKKRKKSINSTLGSHNSPVWEKAWAWPVFIKIIMVLNCKQGVEMYARSFEFVCKIHRWCSKQTFLQIFCWLNSFIQWQKTSSSWFINELNFFEFLGTTQEIIKRYENSGFYFPICKVHGSVLLITSFKTEAIVTTKNVMQGKLIAVAYTLRTYWNQFSLGGICKQE